MAEGGTERDELLRNELKAMTPEAFEQLTYELARREDQEVKRLTHPDGGADTLRPQTDDEQAVVWQAKHYSKRINWDECEKSLNSAAVRWRPSEATRGLIPRAAGHTRKGERHSGEGLDVERSRPAAEPARRYAKAFLWLHSDDDVGQSDRALQAGGKLEDAPDLIERAKAIAEFTETADPDFTYQTASGGPSTPAPSWEELPYMTMTAGDTETRLHVASWPREGAEIQDPEFFFINDEPGQAARAEAVRALAEGCEAVVTEGARVRMHAPKLFREGLEGPGPSEVRLSPGKAIPMQMDIQTADQKIAFEVELRPVPQPPGAAAAFAGLVGNALVEISIHLLEEPQVQANVKITGSLLPTQLTTC